MSNEVCAHRELVSHGVRELGGVLDEDSQVGRYMRQTMRRWMGLASKKNFSFRKNLPDPLEHGWEKTEQPDSMVRWMKPMRIQLWATS